MLLLTVRYAVEGLAVPIGAILKNDHSFGPEDIANLTAAFEAALTRLGLTDRKDLVATSQRQSSSLRRTASAILRSCATAL